MFTEAGSESVRQQFAGAIEVDRRHPDTTSALHLAKSLGLAALYVARIPPFDLPAARADENDLQDLPWPLIHRTSRNALISPGQ